MGAGDVPSGAVAVQAARSATEGRAARPGPGPLSRAGCLVAALALAGCASAGAAGQAATHRVPDVVESPPLDQVHWGILAVDAATGAEVLSHGAHRKFVPASNMKVVVTAAALARLGPDHRFRTSLHAVGPLRPAGGVLEGDLVLVGTGDPTLSERFWPDDEAPLRALADSAVAAGLARVEGALVIDASAWDSTSVAGSWMVSNLPWYYSATGGAFAVAEGETRVVVRGGDRPGVPATVEWSPRGERGFVVSRVRTVGAGEEARLDVSWLPESRRIELRGTVPAGGADTLRLATRDPVRQAAALLLRLLEERGVEVEGGWRVAWDPEERVGAPGSVFCVTGDVPGCAYATSVAVLDSPPLMAIVEGVLEPSQNWMAEQLARSLGASDTTRAGWESGLEAVERTLVDEMGVDSLDLELRDASGMSAYSLLTPRAVVRTLRWALERPWADAWRAALAEPGEEESTLQNRLPELQGRLQAKTGTISNVNSLSGYLVADDGRTVVFSVLTNGSGLPSATVRAAIDRVVLGLAGR